MGITQHISQALPFRIIRNATKKWKPPGFEGVSLYDVMRYIGKHFDVPALTEKAAAISYNFIMSIPPTCLFIFTLIPNLPFISKTAMKFQLHSLIRDIVPSHTYNKGMIDFVDSFIEGSKIGLISFTFIISLFFASNAVMGLMRSFNKKDQVGFEKIRGLKRRWEAIRLTLMLFGLLLLTLVLLLMQKNILEWIGIHNLFIRNLILYVKWLFIGALIFFSFAFIYRFAPSTTTRWNLISPGAVIGTILSIIVTIGFSFFVESFGRYNILYGSIGTVMVIMVIIFLNSLSVFIGFIFNLSIHSLKSEEEAHPRTGKTNFEEEEWERKG